MRADIQAQLGEIASQAMLDVQWRLLGLHELAPGVWSGTPEQLANALEEAKASGHHVEGTFDERDITRRVRIDGKDVELNNRIERRRHPSDDHEYQYDALHPGPLSDETKYGDPKVTGNPVPAQGFYGGKYDQHVLAQDTVFYRIGDGEREWGQWFTDEPLQSEAQYRIDVAVKREWTDPATGRLPVGSTRSQKQLELWSYTAVIPKGTVVYSGPVASQGGVHMGGPSTKQYFIPEPWKLVSKGAKIIAKVPFKRDGHVQPRPVLHTK